MSKANQFAKDQKAEVGIGTMIVFIATILVAAIAAGVLINTSQKLQDKSTRTGNDATAQVGSSLLVSSVYGTDTGADGSINILNVYVQLAAGSDPIDLADVIVQVKSGTSTSNLNEATGFDLFDGDGTTAATDTVMASGETMVIQIPAQSINANTKVSLTFVPQSGLSSVVSFTTPLTYNGATTLTLY